MTHDNTSFTDEMLTAYLDGELDAEDTKTLETALATDDILSGRLAALDFPKDALHRVMDPAVLGAPALPPSVLAATKPAAPPHHAPAARPRHLAPLALVASFLVGMVATTLIQPLPEPTPDQDWTAAVASYQALYVPETLGGARQDQAVTDAVLSRASDEFDVSLAPATQIDTITFKRAQMLGFRGQPLLQMAYLTEDDTPLALCLFRTGEPNRDTADFEMFDLSGVSWVKDGVGYFLIGGDDIARVQDLSRAIIARL